ncbi:Similar to Protein AF-9 homolog; acc. no. Q4WPM8 [Pyronema omphalodes CBS 100304]|uniref:Protein AF-9 homolog n=1 Tax=Pyronema omphalodes (strain CBS 100304) TaxID=1076935 RepID=U4L689_PYROM|nr:Similar to Protein AF-9 homolog; acc. no. Q4WPM8 [Pyronema omphalodes CBS 100304]
MPPASQTKRIKGISVFRPIVYGNSAQPVDPDNRPRGMPADHTHTWTVSFAGNDGQDITHFIKKVQFKLHADSYANPVRTIEQPPFEVTESGWGEFEIPIKIFFHPESNEKPLTMFHYLKLHPYIGTEAEMEQQRVQRKPITSYIYDELVFNEPTEAFYDVLTSKGNVRIPTKSSARGRGEFVRETEEMEVERIGEALRVVDEEVAKAKEKMKAKEKEIAEMQKALEAKR